VLNGVVYAEKATLTMPEETKKSATEWHIPFDPVLSLALQIGPGNTFAVEQLKKTLSATLPFTPTQYHDSTMISPLSMADQVLTPGTKPIVDHADHWLTAEEIQTDNYSGTKGWVVGTLNDPSIEVQYALVPRKGTIELPGGVYMTVQSGTGQFSMSPFSKDADKAVRLNADAVATGTVDRDKITMDVDGNLIVADGETLPVTISMSGNQMTWDEFSKRIIGYDIINVLSNNNQGLTPIVAKYSTQVVFGDLFKMLANRTGLGTVNVAFDPQQEYLSPEATVTTQEFGITKWSAFSLGASRKFSTPPEWKLWMDYRMPENKAQAEHNMLKYLRNLSINAEANEKSELGINLQYKYEF